MIDWLYGTGTRRFGVCFMAEEGEVDEGGETGGGGGGAGGSPDIQKAIDEATKGIKKNRDELKAEKTRLQEQYSEINGMIEGLGGVEGLKKLSEMRERLNKDEMGKLLAEGKHEEWYDKRVASMKSSHEAAVKSLQEKLEAATAQADMATRRMTDSLLSSRISSLCAKEGVVETAMEDVMRAAREVFTFDPESDLFVMKNDQDGVVLGKDGTSPKTIEEWLEEKKEKARHWFPPSQGGGADGDGRYRSGSGPAPDPSKMNLTEYRKYRQEQGMSTGYDHPLARK